MENLGFDEGHQGSVTLTSFYGIQVIIYCYSCYLFTCFFSVGNSDICWRFKTCTLRKNSGTRTLTHYHVICKPQSWNILELRSPYHVTCLMLLMLSFVVTVVGNINLEFQQYPIDSSFLLDSRRVSRRIVLLWWN